MKKGYHYLFYKLYKSIEATSNPKFLSDWKAELVIDVLGIFIWLSLLFYYTVFTGSHINIDNGIYVAVAIYFLFVAVPNYFIFHHKDQWKDYKKEFDKLPKKKNMVGGIVVWSVIILIIANLVFSIYLTDLMARQNHTGPYSKEYVEQQK